MFLQSFMFSNWAIQQQYDKSLELFQEMVIIREEKETIKNFDVLMKYCVNR